MDFKKWEEIVLSWVNCLKLSTLITDLKDLRSGVFFSELIKILKPSAEHDHSTSHILKLLDIQYPNFFLDSENCIDLEDITEQDLLAIASLLLHFSCVLDRRDVLTSPLCHQLPKNTQIQIRFYLENMRKDIRKKDFFKLIEKCIEQGQTKQALHSNRPYSNDVNVQNSRSPLQELLLQTPVKHRSFAKDREIKKLRSEIELERFEKLDLQDELKSQQTKNVKLDKQVSDKSAEIMRLRSEIANLEARTLPTYQDQESTELQRRLRGEINSLEQYVSKLQEELYELYNERDSIKEKLRKVEGQCTIWQEKSTSTEQDFENLIEQHKQQEIELNCLRSHCNELSALLEEMRASTRPSENCLDVDSSINEDVLNSQRSEDLAGAVVELQLRETQKDNIELKNMLNECRENSSMLQKELINVKQRFEKLEIDHDTIKVDNEKLIEKVSKLTETQSTLFDTQEQLENTLKQVTVLSFDNNSLKENIELLHQRVKDTNVSLLDVEASNRLLCTEIQSLQSKNEFLNEDVKNKCDVYSALETQMESLQSKYDTLVDEYNKVDYNFQSISLNFEKLNCEVDQSVRNLEQLILGVNNTLDLRDKNKAFEILFSTLKSNSHQESENKKVLMNRIDFFEELNIKLRNDIAHLEEREVISLKDRQQLYDNFNKAETQIKLLESTITQHVTKIDDLNTVILEMSSTIKDFKVLQVHLEEKQVVINDLEQVILSLEQKLKQTLEELEENKITQKELCKQFEVTDRIRSDFEIQIKELSSKFAVEQNEKQTLAQTVDELKALNNVFKKQIDEINDELLKHKSHEARLNKSINDLQVAKTSLERQIFDVNSRIESQKSKVSFLESEKLENEKQHQQTIKNNILQIEGYTTQIQNLELELHTTKCNYAAAQKDFQLLESTKDELIDQIELCKADFSKRIAAVTNTKQKLQEDLDFAIKDALDIQDQLLQKLQEYNEIKSEKDNITIEYHSSTKQLEDCNIKLDLLEGVCRDKDDILSKTTQDFLVVKLDAEVKSESIAILQQQLDGSNLKIHELENQIELLNEQNEELRTRTTELINESQHLENVKNSLESKCFELENNGWKVVTELASKNEQLEDILVKYNKYQEVTQAKLQNLEVSLAQSKAELAQFIELKNKTVCDKNSEIQDLQQQIDDLNDAADVFKKREIEYIEEIHNIKCELSDNITKFTEFLQIRQEVDAENDSRFTNLTEDLHSIIEKYNALDITHADTMKQLAEAQARLETLENSKLELEMKFLKQKAQFEDDYNKCLLNLNSQIQEKSEHEAILQNEVKEAIRNLDTSQKNYNDLQNHVTKLCSELNHLQSEKAKLCNGLRKFKFAFQDLKNVYSTLKESHLEFVNSNTNSLKDLKVELMEHIELILTKNINLSDTIEELHKKVDVLTNEQELLSAAYLQKLNNKDKEISMLINDSATVKINMNKMIQDKEVLEQCLFEEKIKLRELQEVAVANNQHMQEYIKSITNLKSINDVLETAKTALENEILSKTDKIVELEKLKNNDHNKYEEEISIREAEIKVLGEKIDVLEKNLSQNSFKNGELVLELCTVNQTLENLTKQYTTLQKLFEEEKESSEKKVYQYQFTMADNQSIIQNLQRENEFVTNEITTTKDAIQELKEKLKSSLGERQTLSLEIKFANEKLEEYEVYARKQESAISELNAKLLSKLEETLELEKGKQFLHQKIDELSGELENTKQARDEILESQTKAMKETENHLTYAHKNAMEVKNDLMTRIEQLQNESIKDKQMYAGLGNLMKCEIEAKGLLEVRVLELENEKMTICQLLSSLKHNITLLASSLNKKPVEITFNHGAEFKQLKMDDIENLNQNIQFIQNKITTLLKENEDRFCELSQLKQEKCDLTHRILALEQESQLALQEKEKLFDAYNILSQEKIEQERDLKSFIDFKLEHSILKEKYEQLSSSCHNSDILKTKNEELLEQIKSLEKKTTEIYDLYKKYANYSKTYKINIEKLIVERSELEKVITNSRQMLASIQCKLSHVNDDREKVKLAEQTNAFEIVLEDIQKQSLRCSRKIHEIILTAIQIPIGVSDGIKSKNIVVEDTLKINFEEEHYEISDCKDQANSLLEQMIAFNVCFAGRGEKTQKESVLRSSNYVNPDTKITDDELKKRNVVLKQRLTLAENAKSNLEKKIKQLRQEMKAFKESSDSVYTDSCYKTLLQQHIQSKEDFEKAQSENKIQYNKLLQEFKDYKAKNRFPDKITHEKNIKIEHDIKLEQDNLKLREAYGNVVSENSRLDMENATLKKLLEDRISQLGELKLVKEAYEKLLEENNKLSMEIDTVKYKRNKDREALIEASKNAKMENRKIQEIKNEYEGKLEKMKNKMVQLYKEEINKEIQKHQNDKTEKATLVKTIDQLQHHLKTLQMESVKNKSLEHQNSDVSCVSRDSFFLNPMEVSLVRPSESDSSSTKSFLNRKAIDDRKYSTLPKQMTVIQEDAVLKRNTLSSVPKHLAPDGQNLTMEDEDGDLFNNKYLTDLKEGRCTIPSGRESNASRISELMWRNSFCPPHLKSSYPAETQFSSPGQYKEHHIKLGTGDFNDSMSTRLLPSDKHRKKDFGTTSYKKPGPPTPSRNGGRVSLQSNELRDALLEYNDSKTPKRTTPTNRIKQLFKGKSNISTKENNESQSSTPRSKRLSIFRKAK